MVGAANELNITDISITTRYTGVAGQSLIEGHWKHALAWHCLGYAVPRMADRLASPHRSRIILPLLCSSGTTSMKVRREYIIEHYYLARCARGAGDDPFFS